jgi:hypothetical protein
MNDLNKYQNEDAVKAATRLIDGVLASGYSVNVFDSEEWTLKGSTDREEILNALGTTSDDRIEVMNADGERIGMFWLIYENGSDALSDWHYTDHTERECKRLANICYGEEIF